MRHKTRPEWDNSPSRATSLPASVSRIHPSADEFMEPAGVSAHRASVARVYDAFLGGKDNYAIDRETVATVLAAQPDAHHLFHTENDFRTRACRYLASAGLRQFLVFGSRLSQHGNDPHDVVQRADHEARIVYADNDPLVLAQWRALMYAPNDTVHVAEVNPFDTPAVLTHPDITARIDVDDPVAVILVGTWPFCVAPRDRPAQMMAELVDVLAPGSHIAVSHFRIPPGRSRAARNMETAFQRSPLGAGTFRTDAEIHALLPGLRPIEPGVVPCAHWWANGPRRCTPVDDFVVGAVAVKT